MHSRLLDRWNAISLRMKITGVTVLMLTLGLLVTGIGTMSMLKPVLLDQLDAQLSAASGANYLNTYLFGTSSGSAKIATDASPSDYFAALYDSNGDLVRTNWSNIPFSGRPAVPDHISVTDGKQLQSQGGYPLTSNDGRIAYRAMAQVVTLTSPAGALGTAIVATNTSQIDTVMASFLAIFLGFGVIVIIVGAGLTRMLVTTTFSPLREVERTAAAIADGDFGQRLGGATPNTEVGRLNRSLNTMLNRIDRAFSDRARTIDQMRRFVGDASHELRTPLVSLRGYAELYRMGALQTPDDVAQAMDRIEKEAIRMGILVEDLLELARLDETKPLDLNPVDLVAIARDAAMDAMAGSPGRIVTVIVPPPIAAVAPEPEEPGVDTAPLPVADQPVRPTNATGPIAFAGATLARLRRGRTRRSGSGGPLVMATGEKLISLSEAPPAHPALVLAEENKLRQVVTNLMGNALRYTASDSPIEIGVQVDHRTERAVLEVRDHGDGIPPQIHEKIFQRFWRADTSRTRETGGSGLGLAIVSSIVAAHNGSVDVVETPGGGATFRVSLPLADSTAAPKPIAG
ncbi:histidine kinase [Leifsonia xyli subsp. xyli]|uniref:histidine kinase n=2 Tax=Leifsonia xyli subsp. xyli TaxID=59736 RepID=Q6ADK4_LEIXX|nr:HAMP domain-containing sensor histidine kinase [Leifsonia xyli]AAT89542.1 two-component system, sensor protein [Leifsonia xyli subsp. xyli str. CTCB07]ODA91343.1 histidine kinase [Leifsonia xyli subsp. xyli]